MKNVYGSSHKQQVLGECYALILPYFCHESNLLFSGNMICKKMRNIVCLVERNPMQPEEAGNSSVTLWLFEGEEVGRVARFQSPTKVSIAQFRIFLAILWTFLSTFWGSFEFWQCTAQCVHCSVLFPCSKKSPVANTGEYQITLWLTPCLAGNILLPCSCYRGIFEGKSQI